MYFEDVSYVNTTLDVTQGTHMGEEVVAVEKAAAEEAAAPFSVVAASIAEQPGPPLLLHQSSKSPGLRCTGLSLW